MTTQLGLAELLAMLVTASGCAHRTALDQGERAQLEGAGPMGVAMLDRANPDPRSVLRRPTQPVRLDDPGLALLLERMRATLEETGGVGIAAPQIGISRRAILVRHGTRPKGPPTRVEAYLNPKIVWASKETETDYEACLSIEGVGGPVVRPQRIKLEYEALDGTSAELDLADWDARIAQHEVDHLEGILFIDRSAGALVPLDEARQRRDALHRVRGWLPEAESTR
jgi:peptide deformylase